MGYNTDFEGHFTIDKKVDDDTYNLLLGIATTRRMKRDMKKLYPNMSDKDILAKWGEEGEFYVEGNGHYGQDNDISIIDFNEPPKTQPGLWCQWIICTDHETICWDGGEKFYGYVAWIEYLVKIILAPRGYKVNGEVCWQGEDETDKGEIIVHDNKVDVIYL